MKIRVSWWDKPEVDPDIRVYATGRDGSEWSEPVLESGRCTTVLDTSYFNVALDASKALMRLVSVENTDTFPVRSFLENGEEDPITANLNILLDALDRERLEVREERHVRDFLINGISTAARELKRTRSDKISSIVGGKLHKIRLGLEQLTEGWRLDELRVKR